MHLALFSDFSHKHFVTYSQSVPKEHRKPQACRFSMARSTSPYRRSGWPCPCRDIVIGEPEGDYLTDGPG